MSKSWMLFTTGYIHQGIMLLPKNPVYTSEYQILKADLVPLLGYKIDRIFNFIPKVDKVKYSIIFIN